MKNRFSHSCCPAMFVANALLGSCQKPVWSVFILYLFAFNVLQVAKLCFLNTMITCTKTKMGYSKNPTKTWILNTTVFWLLLETKNGPESFLTLFLLFRLSHHHCQRWLGEMLHLHQMQVKVFSCQSHSTEECVKSCACGAFSFISVWQQQVEKPQRS